MDISQLEHFAPYIMITLIVIWQNNIYVRPEQLEKKHREILEDIKEKYVEINAYKEFQNHIYSTLEEIKEMLQKRRKDD